jgi:LCP family protein required for cell wall assembly
VAGRYLRRLTKADTQRPGLAGVDRFVPDTGWSMSTTGTRPKPPGNPRREGVRPTTHPLRDPGALSPAMRTRRAVTLLLMTLFVPGSAQVTAGNRKLGRVGLRIWFSVLALGVLLLVAYFLDRAFVIGLFARPLFLLVLIAALIVLALVWATLFFDAWRLGAPKLQTAGARRGIAVLTVLLVLGTAGPMLFAAKQASAGRSLVTKVFGGNKTSSVVGGRYNVLLLGGDAGKDRLGLRPDSMTLASIDADSGRTVLFSFPRNMQNVPFPASSPMHRVFPNGYNCGDSCLLNAVYTYASTHKGLYPASVKNPGAQATMDAIQAITGLKVNYYALIDLKGFQRLINAVGGVTINVKTKVPIGGESTKISGYIRPGKRHLTGYQALWYARSRTGSSDYERMARQRCVMTAMLAQLSPQRVLLKFQDIAAASGQVISTSIPDSEVGTFVDLALKAKGQKVTSVQFVPPLVVPKHPDFSVMRTLVANAIATAEKPPSTASPSASASTSHSTSSAGGSSTAKPSTSGEVDAKAVCAAA